MTALTKKIYTKMQTGWKEKYLIFILKSVKDIIY